LDVDLSAAVDSDVLAFDDDGAVLLHRDAGRARLYCHGVTGINDPVVPDLEAVILADVGAPSSIDIPRFVAAHLHRLVAANRVRFIGGYVNRSVGFNSIRLRGADGDGLYAPDRDGLRCSNGDLLCGAHGDRLVNPDCVGPREEHGDDLVLVHGPDAVAVDA